MTAQHPDDLRYISPSLNEYSKFAKLWLVRQSFSSLDNEREAKRAIAKFLRVRKYRKRSSLPVDVALVNEISKIEAEVETDTDSDS